MQEFSKVEQWIDQRINLIAWTWNIAAVYCSAMAYRLGGDRLGLGLMYCKYYSRYTRV